MMDGSVAVLLLRNVLIVSVPGDPDDNIITGLQDKILQSMQRDRAKGVILDLSTVDIVDSFFARTIIDTAQMINLMGGRTIIAGMLPSVAITATQLGLTFENIETCLDVDTAFSSLEADE